MFFDSLKVACAQNGTSPTSLLKKLGMSTSSVTSWKNGVVPSLKTVYQLAEALGIDPAQLLEGSGVAQGEDTKKAPALGISENGREMLELYEKLPEREQLLLIGRLQEMTAPLLGEVKKSGVAEARSSGGKAV